MFLQLCIYALAAVVSYSEAKGPINYTTAASLCRTRYDSQLIPLRYIEDHNLTRDIIEELKPGASAWIDGKIQNMGCSRENCLWIKKIHKRKDTRLPYICVNWKSIIISTESVLYQESEKMCNEDKFATGYMFNLNELIYRIDELPLKSSNQAFWIPNVKIKDRSDTLCTFVTTRENSLDTFTGNCSIHQLGICINNSYIPDYQLTLTLEMTSSITTTRVDQPNSAVESTPISHPLSKVTVNDLGAFVIVVSLTLLASFIFALSRWKKRSVSMRENGKLLENEKQLEV